MKIILHQHWSVLCSSYDIPSSFIVICYYTESLFVDPYAFRECHDSSYAKKIPFVDFEKKNVDRRLSFTLSTNPPISRSIQIVYASRQLKSLENCFLHTHWLLHRNKKYWKFRLSRQSHFSVTTIAFRRIYQQAIVTMTPSHFNVKKMHFRVKLSNLSKTIVVRSTIAVQSRTYLQIKKKSWKCLD